MKEKYHIYEKTFPTPLIAMAFKDGVDFRADPDLEVSYPTKSSKSSHWVVTIKEAIDEDIDDEAPIDAEFVETDKESNSNKVSFKEFQELAKQNKEINIPMEQAIEPCGKCISCSRGGDHYQCTTIINNTLGSNKASV